MATYEGVFIDVISQSKSFCRAICFSVQSKVKIYSDTTIVTGNWTLKSLQAPTGSRLLGVVQQYHSALAALAETILYFLEMLDF
jgi:hypothetical protein